MNKDGSDIQASPEVMQKLSGDIRKKIWKNL
jgi:hypothetical protein